MDTLIEQSINKLYNTKDSIYIANGTSQQTQDDIAFLLRGSTNPDPAIFTRLKQAGASAYTLQRLRDLSFNI